MTVGLLGLSFSIVTVVAVKASPVIQDAPPTIDAVTDNATGLRSPLPDLMSDKAYARTVAEEARIIARLLAHPDADTLATAALMSRFPSKDSGPESPLALIRQATALAPGRPELAWLELTICLRLKCDAETQIETRIQALDPDNGFVWLEALSRSIAVGSEPAVTDLVQRIGASSQITFYFNRLLVMATDALAVGEPRERLWKRASIAIGMVSATSIPPLQPLSRACRVAELTQEGRRAACEMLMSRLEQSSEIIDQLIALSIEARWWPSDSPARALVDRKRRRLQYVLSESSRLRLFRLNHDMAIRIDAARRYEREEDVELAVIRSFGEPTDPPAKWENPFRE